MKKSKKIHNGLTSNPSLKSSSVHSITSEKVCRQSLTLTELICPNVAQLDRRERSETRVQYLSAEIEWIVSRIYAVVVHLSTPDCNSCGCGRSAEKHPNKNSFRSDQKVKNVNWNISRHTTPFPTDAYGTLEFQGGPHPTKARVTFP